MGPDSDGARWWRPRPGGQPLPPHEQLRADRQLRRAEARADAADAPDRRRDSLEFEALTADLQDVDRAGDRLVEGQVVRSTTQGRRRHRRRPPAAAVVGLGLVGLAALGGAVARAGLVDPPTSATALVGADAPAAGGAAPGTAGPRAPAPAPPGPAAPPPAPPGGPPAGGGPPPPPRPG